MSNVSYYNRLSSTFSPVVIAGALAAMCSFPSNVQLDMSRECNKSILGDSYRISSAGTSTYSYLKNLFTGKHDYAVTKFERPWLTPELSAFLLHPSQPSLEAMDYLLSAIHETYGSVPVDAILHTDPEEDWVKPVFIVHSGIEDFDELLVVEDSFFAKATNDSALLAILPFVVVSQA